jgi:FAD/FMN-containing dehydrogenase
MVQKLNNLLENLMTADEPLINTGVLSQSPTQFNSIWALREGLTECVQKEGKPYKYDVSVPLADFQKVVDAVRERMISKGLYGDHAISKVMGYGHVGDGITIFPTYSMARPLIPSQETCISM